MSGRRASLALAIALGIALRLVAGPLTGCDQRIPVIQATYRDVGENVAEGRGYVTSAGGPPIAYYLPAYSYLIAPVERVFGSGCASAQTLNAVLDGTFGPLLAFLALTAYGFGTAAVVAAGSYAIAPPIVLLTAVTAPDGIAPMLTLAPVAAFAYAMRRRRWWLFLVSGALVGIGAMFRAEIAAIAAAFVLPVALTGDPLRSKIARAGALVAGYAAAAAPLAVLWERVYGYMALTRPGIGVRLWAGVGLGTGRFGYEAPDTVAERVLTDHGLVYASVEGDSFLVRDALAQIADAPSLFGAQVLVRSFFVLSEFWGLLILGLAATVIVIRRERLLGVTLGSLWFARFVPFSLLYYQERDVVPLVAITVIAVPAAFALVARRVRGPDRHEAFAGAASRYAGAVERSFAFMRRGLDFFAADKARSITEAIDTTIGGAGTRSVLDVGCGIGTLGAHLSSRVATFHGVDVAPDILAEAARRDPRGTYRLGDGRRLPYPAAAFDVVCAVNVLHHVEPSDRAPFLAEMARVVRPGGVVIVIEHNPWNPLTRVAVARCELDDEAELLTRGEVAALLRATDLHVALTRYVLISPWRGRAVRAIERLLAAIPLGAQHLVVARVGALAEMAITPSAHPLAAPAAGTPDA